MTLAALIFGFREAKNFAKALSSAQWPMIQGKVLSSESGWAGTGKGRHSWMRIRYAYAAEGANWVGGNVTIGNTMERYAIQAVPQTYPAGSAVEVRYRPGSPADSVLEAGVNATHVVNTSGLLFLGGMGLLFLGWQIRAWRRPVVPGVLRSPGPMVPAGRKRSKPGSSARTDGKRIRRPASDRR